VLKRIEALIPQERRGILSLTVDAEGHADEEIRSAIQAGGEASLWNVAYGSHAAAGRRRISCEVRCPGRSSDPPAPDFVRELAQKQGVGAVRWQAH